MELIKRFNKFGITINIFDQNKTVDGQSVLAYELRQNRRPIFKGDSFVPSRLHADDSMATVAALVTFLTLQKGDTDAEYFDNYTPEQIAFSQSDESQWLRLHFYELGN